MSQGAMIGALVGMVIGAFAGGAPGALRGAKIGGMVGSLIAGSVEPVFADAGEGVKNSMEDLFSDVTAMGYGSLIGSIVGMVIGAIAGGFAGGMVLPGAKAGAMIGAALGSLGGLVYNKLKESGIIDNTIRWFKELGGKVSETWNKIWDPTTWKAAWTLLKGWFSNLKDRMSTWFTDRKTSVKTWWSNLWDTSNWTSGWTKIKTWFTSLKTEIQNWFSSLKTSIGNWWDGLWDGKSAKTTSTPGSFTINPSMGGHATGGIFNREHIARFAEGNKTEAIIPLENSRAMQPFVDAVSTGLMESLAPSLLSSGGSSNQLPPMYVGTLIADERGIKELYKKFEVIQAQEYARKGLAY